MTTTEPSPTARSVPRTPRLERRTAMRLAATEYDRFVAQLRTLSPDDWAKPTACPAWDVHAMAAHVLGMAEFAASPLEQMRQMRAAKRAGGLFIDALTAFQVSKHVHRSPADLVGRLAVVGAKAAKGRRRTPGVVRRIQIADQPVDETGTTTEPWRLGYLVDVILTRDTWMHRSDIAAAVGRPMELTAEHDGVLVADVAAEWGERHGRPCSLTLTGPAGGRWTFGDTDREPGPSYELDAVQFCRVAAGRGSAEGLLATRVPF